MSTSYAVHEQHFATVHHNTVGPFVEIMLSVYVRCQWKTAKLPVDLSKAHDHVFGNKDSQQAACEWCSSTFQSRRDYQLGFFAGKDDLNNIKSILAGIDSKERLRLKR